MLFFSFAAKEYVLDDDGDDDKGGWVKTRGALFGRGTKIGGAADMDDEAEEDMRQMGMRMMVTLNHG